MSLLVHSTRRGRWRRHCMKILSRLSLIVLSACATQQPPVQPDAGSASSQALPSAPIVATKETRVPAATNTPSTATPEKITALRNWVDQHERLYVLAAPLLLNNTPLCKRNAQALLGLTAKTQYSYSMHFADAARNAYGLDDRLSIMNVLPGSGAEKSGLRRGDVLLAAEGRTLPEGPNAEQEAAAIIAGMISGRSALQLTIARNGKEFSVDVPLTQACAIAIELGNTDDVIAYADGRRAMIARGMMSYTRSDEELAYVLAKEIAHAILAQSPRPNITATIDALRLPALVTLATGNTSSAKRIKPYSPVLDATGDKLALYMLARAGYKIDNAIPFWQTLAQRYPPTMKNGYTALHPSTSYRISVMTAVSKRLKDKLANQWPLIP